jgi:NTP pyrophosphatase (non-canonical NTP hydrolase)
MENRTKKLLIAAIEKYGIDSQLGIVQEECAELIVAISHFRRLNCLASLDQTSMIDEIADVSIMLTQCQLMFDYEKIKQRITYKLSMLSEKLASDV